MKQLMRYEIQAGRVVEQRDVMLDISPEKAKKGGRRIEMDVAQVERNRNEAVRCLARTLNCNCSGGEAFLTLKYSDVRLPKSREEAEQVMKNLVRRLRRAALKATGEKLELVAVTADTSAKTGEPVRLHHHLVVIGGLDWALLAKHWPPAEFSFRYMDSTGEYTAVATYMIKNAGYRRGKKTWSPSRGLKKPKFGVPRRVKGLGSFVVPQGARIVEREVRQNGESGFCAAYVRYVLAVEGRPTGELTPQRSTKPRGGKAATGLDGDGGVSEPTVGPTRNATGLAVEGRPTGELRGHGDKKAGQARLPVFFAE